MTLGRKVIRLREQQRTLKRLESEIARTRRQVARTIVEIANGCPEVKRQVAEHFGQATGNLKRK